MCKSRGADMTNFKACAQCGAFKVLKMKSIESTTDEDDETGMYNERIIYQRKYLIVDGILCIQS